MLKRPEYFLDWNRRRFANLKVMMYEELQVISKIIVLFLVFEESFCSFSFICFYVYSFPVISDEKADTMGGGDKHRVKGSLLMKKANLRSERKSVSSIHDSNHIFIIVLSSVEFELEK